MRTKLAFFLTTFVLPVVMALPSEILYGEDKITIAFQDKSYEIKNDQIQQLEPFLSNAKSSDKIIAIKDLSLGLKTSSMLYLIEKNRGLRLFQEMVRLGIDPARIEYKPTKPMKQNDSGLVIELISSEELKSTSAILPSQQVEPYEGQDFTINFPTASAIPVNLDEAKFRSFLASVGQPGRDAVVIEGFTDTVGNASYNQALGDLRALSVYEKLIRSGLPPYRVDTKSQGATAARVKGESASDRRVLVRWTRNDAIAEQAKVKEEPKIPDPKEEIVESPKPEIIQDHDQPTPEEKPGFDLIPFIGALIPAERLKSHAKSALNFGLGIGKAFPVAKQNEMRINAFVTGKSKHQPIEDDRDGPLFIQAMLFRTDYVFDQGALRPFIGLGLGAFQWKATISQPSTARENSGTKTDTAAFINVGLEFILQKNLFLAAEIHYYSISGDFAESLLNPWLSLRWRM